MYGKPLAYIVKIKDIREIPGADRIELATVMDYTVVVKKNEYKPGDFGLYVEVDSVLPDDAEKFPFFEFLRDKKFKIKSMKLGKFGVISQGILFKPSDIGLTNVKVGQDYTQQFKITEIVQDEEEAGLTNNKKKDNWFIRKLMRYKWFRDWRKRHNVSETWHETFPGKSDEENVQKIYTEMYEKYANEEWVATEKLEGQNITIYTEEVNGLFGKTKRVGVCSRTRELNKNGTGKNFWDTVIREKLDERIKAIPGEWWCRGEHLGPGIQKNIYKLPRTTVRFFDFYRKEYYNDTKCGKERKFRWVKLNFEESVAFAKQWNLPFVPVLDEHYKLPTGGYNEKGVYVSGSDIMLQQSDKTTVFGNDLKHKREGFVLRLRNNYNVSFKVKNPNYSL